MTQQRAGFARTEDGLQLYWRAVGEGPPIICCNGVGVSTFFWKYVAEHFQETHTVVLWDYRGHGRSSLPDHPESADLSIEVNASDIAVIRKAVGIQEPAVLMGHSMGCQVILEAAKQRPAEVAALVPMFGTFGRPLDTFMDNPHSRKVFGVVSKLSSMGGRQGARMLLPLYASPIAFALGRYTGVVDKHYAQKIDIDRYLEHLGHMDQRVFMRMVHLIADHDMEEHLPEIGAPTLVIAGEKDLFTPLHRSERMVELIPDAELLVIAEGSHAAIVEHPDTINQRVTRFLHQRLGRFPEMEPS